MLAEYYASHGSRWLEVFPGVRVCFSLAEEDHSFSGQPQQKPGFLEAVFCQEGRLELMKNGSELIADPRDILLVSDCAALTDLRIARNSRGILVQIDSKKAGTGILRTLLGDWEQCMTNVREHMQRHQGCRLLHATPWNQSVFAALDSMEPARQGMYCVLKSAELLYLIYTSPVFKTAGSAGGYVSKTVEDVRKYMEAHLDAKLTIAVLSHRFHISPTALKSGFRQLYGIPIHRWLQNQRMNHAAGLLRDTPLTVLQVAQTVGYEGMSQFNITFRQQFGMTPVQYKKMSNSVNI